VAAASLSCVCSRNGGGGPGLALDEVAKAKAAAFALDEAAAGADLATMTAGPHPFGSARQGEITAWLKGRIEASGLAAKTEPFAANVPNPAAAAGSAGPVSDTLEKRGANVYAFGAVKPEAPCVVLLASHYDTKIVDGVDYVGANDSGSSSVLLLQVLKALKGADAICDVVGVWFDGEEAVLANWSDGEERHPARLKDNTYGSRHAAGRLTACDYDGVAAKCLPADLGGKPLVALVLMDMVGSPDVKLSLETHSTARLVNFARRGSDALGLDLFATSGTAIDDDHIAYLAGGVPAMDMIDFNHLSYWHRAGDEAANVSLASLGTVGKVAAYTALGLARSPKAALQD
jgi:hypothetical protein